MQLGKPSAKFIAPSLFCPTHHFYKPIISTSFFYKPILEHMSCFLQIIMHPTDSYIAKLQTLRKMFWNLNYTQPVHIWRKYTYCTIQDNIYISVAHCNLQLMTSNWHHYHPDHITFNVILTETFTSRWQHKSKTGMWPYIL